MKDVHRQLAPPLEPTPLDCRAGLEGDVPCAPRGSLISAPKQPYGVNNTPMSALQVEGMAAHIFRAKMCLPWAVIGKTNDPGEVSGK